VRRQLKRKVKEKISYMSPGHSSWPGCSRELLLGRRRPPDQKRSCSRPGWDSTGWPRCNRSPGRSSRRLGRSTLQREPCLPFFRFGAVETRRLFDVVVVVFDGGPGRPARIYTRSSHHDGFRVLRKFFFAKKGVQMEAMLLP